MITRIEDGPAVAGGVLVAYTDGEGGPAVLLQLDRVRYVLDATEAREMAAAIEHVAALVETGGPAPGAKLLPIDASGEEIAAATDHNRRVGRA